MAKGEIPNTNSQASANSVDQKMQPTGNMPMWQRFANGGASFPGGITQQGPFGGGSTMNAPIHANSFIPGPSGGPNGMMKMMLSNLFHSNQSPAPAPQMPDQMQQPMMPLPNIGMGGTGGDQMLRQPNSGNTGIAGN